jgi:hypothetical protein
VVIVISPFSSSATIGQNERTFIQNTKSCLFTFTEENFVGKANTMKFKSITQLSDQMKNVSSECTFDMETAIRNDKGLI